MIAAVGIKNKVIVSLWGGAFFQLERKKKGEDWLVLDSDGKFTENPSEIMRLSACDWVDNSVSDGLYQYRTKFVAEKIENEQEEIEQLNNKEVVEDKYYYSLWVICGSTGPIGYSFCNYEHPENQWGEVVTPDDIRFTYLWGTDLKAANGQSFDDNQIRYFIKSALAELSRQLNITVEKKRVVCNARNRNLKKNEDYDIDEDYYRFNWDKIARYGKITTRLRPIIQLNRIAVKGRIGLEQDITEHTEIDKNKGVLMLLKRPLKPSLTKRNIASSIGMYGDETVSPYLFYEIDYEAGYENSDEVPDDLREIIAKIAAVSMLNVVGDGLMSGFSSSSLSMDGMSESFSSTQSATSAYFGARIKEYKDDIDRYIKANKRKFTNIPMGCL